MNAISLPFAPEMKRLNIILEQRLVQACQEKLYHNFQIRVPHHALLFISGIANVRRLTLLNMGANPRASGL